MREKMKAFWALPVLLFLPCTAAADGLGFHDDLLDRMVGDWVMTGTIGGDEITHDFAAEWVLDHWYLQITEVSREQNDEGEPAYEAIVYIGWDESTSHYSCLWLDVTGGGGLDGDAIGYAKPAEGKLPFVFATGDGSFFYTTFAYDRDSDTWKLEIDVVRGGETSEFARVTLKRP